MPKSKSKDIKISSTFLPSSTFKYVCYIVKPIVFKHVSKYNNPSKAIIGCRYLLFKADQLRRSSLNESTQLSNTINVASINRNSLNRSMSIQQVDSQKIPQFFFPQGKPLDNHQQNILKVCVSVFRNNLMLFLAKMKLLMKTGVNNWFRKFSCCLSISQLFLSTNTETMIEKFLRVLL